MALPVQALSDDVSVAPQLSPQDMAAVAAAGYKSVIINRPDMEGGPEQPTSQSIMDAGREAGLEVIYQPVVSGAMTQDDVTRFTQLMDSMPKPILAFCRTGTRCTVMYRAATGQG